MAQQNEEQDRTEPATPFKLKEAKRRGQVAKSMEVNSFLLIGAALAFTYAWGESVVRSELGMSRAIFTQLHRVSPEPEAIRHFFSGIFGELMSIYGLLVAAGLSVAVLANLLQIGPIFSGHPLKPDFKRMNPATNLKKLFSTKLLFETTKSFVKLALFAGVIFLVIQAMLPVLLSTMDRDPHSYGALLLDSARGLVFKLLVVLAIVAMLDVLYVRWDYARNMRMSRRELREEHKRREGDPQVRAKMRELQKEAARRTSSLKRVPEADVLITNPVHLAVALRYDRVQMQAPKVVAKGAAELAARMRELAARHRIPVVEDKPLARSLYRGVGVDQEIPETLYPVVARLLAAVFRTRNPAVQPSPGAVGAS